MPVCEKSLAHRSSTAETSLLSYLDDFSRVCSYESDLCSYSGFDDLSKASEPPEKRFEYPLPSCSLEVYTEEVEEEELGVYDMGLLAKPLSANVEACFDESLDVNAGIPKLACDRVFLHALIEEVAEGPAMLQPQGGRMHEILARANEDAECLGSVVPSLAATALAGAPALALRRLRESAGNTAGGETAGSSDASDAAAAAAAATGIPSAPRHPPPEGRPSRLRDRHCFHSLRSEVLTEDIDASIALRELP